MEFAFIVWILLKKVFDAIPYFACMSLQGLLAKFYDVCSQTLGNSFESWGTSHCKNLASNAYRIGCANSDAISIGML